MIYNTCAYTHVGVDQDYNTYENGTYNVIALKEVPCVFCTCVSRVGGGGGVGSIKPVRACEHNCILL